MMPQDKFPCIGCGLCCTKVGQVLAGKEEAKDPYKQELLDFPYKALENGHCEMLDDNLQCKVYENRPDLCSVETMYKKHFSQEDQKEHYRATAVSCNILLQVEGRDERVIID